MKEHRHSKQRDAIMDYLHSTSDHPTAETIYASIREQIPNLSLGTVYRNLALLEELGMVHKIPQGAEPDRFDADMNSHEHLRCTVCGSISDIHIDSSSLDKMAELSSGSDITGHDIIFYGICPQCKNIKEN